MIPNLPISGAQTLMRCPKCVSPHVIVHIDETGPGDPVTKLMCRSCDHTWETRGGRLTPANVDETGKCLIDLELYGMAFLDADGKRVHPSMAIMDEDGLHDSNGRPLFKPTPVMFP